MPDGFGLQSSNAQTAPIARHTAMDTSPAMYEWVVWRSQPMTTGPKKPPRLPMELITAMWAAMSGPASERVEVLQKTGMEESMPMAARLNPAMATEALGANAAMRKPAAAAR